MYIKCWKSENLAGNCISECGRNTLKTIGLNIAFLFEQSESMKLTDKFPNVQQKLNNKYQTYPENPVLQITMYVGYERIATLSHSKSSPLSMQFSYISMNHKKTNRFKTHSCLGHSFTQMCILP